MILDFTNTLREKCPYSEFLCSLFSRIRIEYREIHRIFPYSVRMRQNTDQKNTEYGHFSRSDRNNATLKVFVIYVIFLVQLLIFFFFSHSFWCSSSRSWKIITWKWHCTYSRYVFFIWLMKYLKFLLLLGQTVCLFV